MLPFVSHPSSSSWGCWRRSAFPFILCLSIITVSSATATLNRGLSVDGANAGTVGTPGAASPEPSGRYEEEKETEICTQNLRDAVNAAISHVIGSRELTDHLLPLWGADAGAAYVPLLVCGPSVSPPVETQGAASSPEGVSSLPWPEKEALLPDDLLSEILRSGIVRIAGVGRGAEGGFKRPQKGIAGDFTTDTPTGFFPDYLRAIWRIIGHRYGASVSLSFRFYPSVEAAQAAVIRGEADMTDIYFLLSHRNQVIRNPLSALYMTCPVIGAALLVYTRENEAETFEGLIQALTKAFMNKEDQAKTTVVVCTEELKAAVEPILPDWTQVEAVDSVSVALKAVSTGDALAAFCLGSSTSVMPPPGVFLRESIDVILGKGGWIRRSRSTKCLRREHFKDLTADTAK